MTLYIIVALFPLVIGYLYNISSGQNASLGLATENGQVNNHQLKVRWRWLALAAFPMFLVIAIRGYHMGADTSVYLKFFDYVKNVSLDQALWINQTGADFEVGYVVFEKVVSLFTKNHNVYQTIESEKYLNEVFKTIEEYKKTLKKNSKNKEIEDKLNAYYKNIDYKKITEQDTEVMDIIIEFFNNTIGS